MTSRPFTFDRVIRIIIGLAIIAGLFVLINRLSGILLPFLIAWLITYMLNPVVRFFQYRLRFKNRLLSVVVTLLVTGGVFTGLGWLFVPMIVNELQRLSDLVSIYSNHVDILAYLPHEWQRTLNYYISHLDVRALLQNENFVDGIKKLLPQLWDFLYGSLNFVFGVAVIFVILLYLIFLMLDFDKFLQSWPSMIPSKYRGLISGIVYDIETAMNRYFRGQALVALIAGILFSIGFLIIGLPLAIVLGLFIGLLCMVPYLHGFGLIPAMLLALLKSAESGQSFWSIAMSVIIVFAAVQLVEDLILTPRIMGKVTGMNPALILLSLSAWGSLMGFVGLIIALPMTTLIISYYRRFVLKESAEAAHEEVEFKETLQETEE